jgi:hypothetical protein
VEVLAAYIFYPIFSPAVIRYIFVNQAGPGGLDRGAEAGGDRLAPFWFYLFDDGSTGTSASGSHTWKRVSPGCEVT